MVSHVAQACHLNYMVYPYIQSRRVCLGIILAIVLCGCGLTFLSSSVTYNGLLLSAQTECWIYQQRAVPQTI